MPKDRLRVAGVVQARLGSKRLPRKAMLPLNGRPMFLQVAERLKFCKELDQVALAIPYTDTPLLTAGLNAGYTVTVGAEFDLIERFTNAFDGLVPRPDAIVRITADCPLIDPHIVDELLIGWRNFTTDYGSNVHPLRSYPDGLDCEVFTPAFLQRCRKAAGDSPIYKEEFTRLAWEGKVEVWPLHVLAIAPDFSDLAWSVNTPEEYPGAQVVYAKLGPTFSLHDVLKAFGRKGLPQIALDSASSAQ